VTKTKETKAINIQFNVNKTSDKNKNVDIQFSAHDAFLEKPSSGDAQDQNIRQPNNSK